MKDAKIDYFRIKEQNATAEAWLVEYTDKNVLYIPLHSLLIELTTKGRNDIRTYIDSQAMSGTMSEVIAQIQQSAVADTRDRAEEEYAPTVIGLGLTDICQLKCVYCHSDSGQESQCSTMPFAVAKKAIDFAAQNAKNLTALWMLDLLAQVSKRQYGNSLQKSFVISMQLPKKPVFKRT